MLMTLIDDWKPSNFGASNMEPPGDQAGDAVQREQQKAKERDHRAAQDASLAVKHVVFESPIAHQEHEDRQYDPKRDHDA